MVYNLDGIDDIGLWLPDSPLPRPGFPDEPNQARDGLGEWYVLNSDRTGAAPSAIFNVYAPTPLGNDVFARAGASGSQPVFGNFDPPPHTDIIGGSDGGNNGGGGTTGPGTGSSNAVDRFDTNADGFVTPLDVLLVINALNEVGGGQLPDVVAQYPRFIAPRGFVDSNRDGKLTPFDALVIINQLNSSTAGEGEGDSGIASSASFVFSTHDAERLSSIDTKDTDRASLVDAAEEGGERASVEFLTSRQLGLNAEPTDATLDVLGPLDDLFSCLAADAHDVGMPSWGRKIPQQLGFLDELLEA